ncbi:MAG: hypothetical protein IH937_11575 [Acidobacteria bacterium]|nr:hypothetical protein [Acidobacteriota bacterium]
MAQEDVYDLIIVGGGTAGCILAARIAEKGFAPLNAVGLNVTPGGG